MPTVLEEVANILDMPFIPSTLDYEDLIDVGGLKDCTYLGEIDPLTIADVVRLKTAEWVAKFDREINQMIGGYKGDEKLENGDIYHPPIDVNILRSRFISYSEYLSLFTYPTSYERNLSYITFRAVQVLIPNVPNFTSENSNSLIGYKSFLAKYSPRLRDHFLKSALAYIPNSARKMHTYITGGSGSGKSEMLKMLAYSTVRKNARNPHDKRKRESLIVIDPHGDLAEGIARFKEHEKGAELIYVDLTLRAGFAPSINPFDIDIEKHDQRYIELLTQEITEAFTEIVGDDSLSNQMKMLLNPCIAVILKKKNGSIKDLQRFMDDENNSDLVELGKQADNPSHSSFFASKFYSSNYNSTKNSVYSRLQLLLNSTDFRNFVDRPSTINLEQDMDEGKSIIFNLSQGAIGIEVAHALGRLVMARIKSNGLRRANMPEHLRMTTHVLIDECQNFISPSIDKIVTEARKYAIHLTLAQQILGQNMDAKLRDIILGNSGVKIVGLNALATLRNMAQETGTELETLQSLTTGKFLVKVTNPQKPVPSFVLTVPPLLIKGRNNGSNWKGVCDEQVARYYKKVSSDKAINQRYEQQQERQGEAVRGSVSGSDKKDASKGKKRARKPKFRL